VTFAARLERERQAADVQRDGPEPSLERRRS
jgi:hypothetical protein